MTSTTMKAVQILGPKTNPQITLNPAHPLPSLDNANHDGHPLDPAKAILIRVHSAGLTGDEITWPELYDHNPTRIPGLEVSGVVAQLPPGYTGKLAVGDDVYALLHTDRGGRGQAEYVYARADEVARKPRTLSHARAAALPVPALTAWEALFKRVPPGLPEGGQQQQGQQQLRILVTGASGAVGSLLVQLARRRVPGARVVALASGAREGYLRELGADEVVDYAVPDWEEGMAKSVDAVFDTVGKEVLAKCWTVVKDDGVLVTVGDLPPAWAFGKGVAKEAEGRPGLRYDYFIVSPDREALEEVARLIDEGAVKPLPVVEYPADKAVDAWEFARQRSRHGKVVINFVADD
ncbi:hypothetical protein VTK56DRAFT_2300 [Thermocarpiscus australiensis]